MVEHIFENLQPLLRLSVMNNLHTEASWKLRPYTIDYYVFPNICRSALSLVSAPTKLFDLLDIFNITKIQKDSFC